MSFRKFTHNNATHFLYFTVYLGHAHMCGAGLKYEVYDLNGNVHRCAIDDQEAVLWLISQYQPIELSCAYAELERWWKAHKDKKLANGYIEFLGITPVPMEIEAAEKNISQYGQQMVNRHMTYRTFTRSSTSLTDLVKTRKRTVKQGLTFTAARDACKSYNDNRTSRQLRKGTLMEFESE